MGWTVRDVMTGRADLVVGYADTSFKHAVELMQMRDVSALPVVDARDRVVGVVSEADLLVKQELHPGLDERQPRHRAGAGQRRRAAALTVGDLMTTPAVTVAPAAPVAEAARIMHESGVKRLPVVDEEGRLLGVASRRDLLAVFLRADKDLEQELEYDLRRLLWIPTDQLEIHVQRGVVSLRGEVETRSLAEIAARLAAGLAGVVSVRSQLTYRRDDRHPAEDDPTLALQYAASERRL